MQQTGANEIQKQTWLGEEDNLLELYKRLNLDYVDKKRYMRNPESVQENEDAEGT